MVVSAITCASAVYLGLGIPPFYNCNRGQRDIPLLIYYVSCTVELPYKLTNLNTMVYNN